MNVPHCYVEHTLPLLFRSAVDCLKVGMYGVGKFKEKMIGGDYSLTIVYAELRKKFEKLEALFSKPAGVKDAHESSPVDEKYR
jgi:hypothetical protein